MTWRSNLAGGICRAALRKQRYQLPRLSELVNGPEFDALRQYLAGRGATLSELQSAIDQLVKEAYQQVEAGIDPAQVPRAVRLICERLEEAAAAHQPLETILAELRSSLLSLLPAIYRLATAS